MMKEKDCQVESGKEEKKPLDRAGFFGRLISRLDSAMKAKAEEKGKESSCCGGDGDKGKGQKCC